MEKAEIYMDETQENPEAPDPSEMIDLEVNEWTDLSFGICII